MDLRGDLRIPFGGRRQRGPRLTGEEGHDLRYVYGQTEVDSRYDLPVGLLRTPTETQGRLYFPDLVPKGRILWDPTPTKVTSVGHRDRCHLTFPVAHVFVSRYRGPGLRSSREKNKVSKED